MVRAADRSYETNVWDAALELARAPNGDGFHIATYGALASEEAGAPDLRLLALGEIESLVAANR